MDKELKLNVLLELTKAINSNLSNHKLIKLLEVIFKLQLQIPAGYLLIKTNEGWQEEMCFGINQKIDTKTIDPDVFNLSNIRIIKDEYKNIKQYFDVVIPVYHDIKATAFLFLKDKKETDLFAVSSIMKNLHFIQTLLSLAVVAIKNKMLTIEVIEKEKLFREMELATEVQRMLIPTQIPSFKTLDIHSIYLPHSQLSGDYFDFIQLNDNELLISLADIAGKGISAALLMASAQSFLKAITKYRHDIAEMAVSLNKLIFDNTNGERFLSMFLAKYNTESRELSYINLGHPYPILLMNEKCVELNSTTYPIGVTEFLEELKIEKIKLEKNSILCCFTDGLIEIEKDNGEVFDTSSLKNIICSKNYTTVSELNTIILNSIIDFRQEGIFEDDITLFSIQFN